jgi:hypothetical protein
MDKSTHAPPRDSQRLMAAAAGAVDAIDSNKQDDRENSKSSYNSPDKADPAGGRMCLMSSCPAMLADKTVSPLLFTPVIPND